MDRQDSNEGSEDVDHPRGGFCILLDTLHCHGHLVRVLFKIKISFMFPGTQLTGCSS